MGEEPRARPGHAMAEHPPGDSFVGSCVGHCLLERRLGQGGMGAVYLARHTILQKPVAVKLLRSDLPFVLAGVDRFQRESQAAGKLDHPNIVRVHDAGAHEGYRYIVMEYVEGESLAARLTRAGPLPLPETLRIFRAIARGVRHAHQQGVIHRDIKPDNVLLGADGSVKLTDFGLARLSEGDPNVSATGTILGSPNFMSPEQALGERDVDQRTDVYSLGSTLYCMVVGAPPFKGDSTLGIVYKVVKEALVPPHVANPSVPLGLSQFVCLLMRKDRTRRIASVDQVLAILERICPNRTREGGAAPARSKRLDAAAVMLGSCLLAFGLMLAPWRGAWLSLQSGTAEARSVAPAGGSRASTVEPPSAPDAEAAPSALPETPDEASPAAKEAQAAAETPPPTAEAPPPAPAARTFFRGDSARSGARPAGKLLRRAQDRPRPE